MDLTDDGDHWKHAAGLDPVTSASPDQFAGFIRAEIIKWAPVVKASGAKAD